MEGNVNYFLGLPQSEFETARTLNHVLSLFCSRFEWKHRVCLGELFSDTTNALSDLDHKEYFVSAAAFHTSTIHLLRSQRFDVRLKEDSNDIIHTQAVPLFKNVRSDISEEYHFRAQMMLLKTRSPNESKSILCDFKALLTKIGNPTSAKLTWTKVDLLMEIGERECRVEPLTESLEILDKLEHILTSVPSFDNKVFSVFALFRASIYFKFMVVNRYLNKESTSQKYLGLALKTLGEIEADWPSLYCHFSTVVWFPEKVGVCRLIFDTADVAHPSSLLSCWKD